MTPELTESEADCEMATYDKLAEDWDDYNEDDYPRKKQALRKQLTITAQQGETT